ncbi:MAG TPA: hypothetical protein VLD19_17725 [Chitinophagaceae bacterium]|nr:hypothetical protein [Chitinophagaceae bacterium]
MHNIPAFEIKPYTPAELARLYGISKPTFRKWLNPHLSAIGKRIGHFYNALQVKTIFEKLGLPSEEAHDS